LQSALAKPGKQATTKSIVGNKTAAVVNNMIVAKPLKCIVSSSLRRFETLMNIVLLPACKPYTDLSLTSAGIMQVQMGD
jgi:hypothetical protein